MTNFRLTFLGTAGARPTVERGLTALLAGVHSDRVLIDCGEGTQRQLLRYGVGFRTDMVLFTHFHADHYLGIVGYLRTLAMQDRQQGLTLYGPGPDLHDLCQQLIYLGYRQVPFPLELVELSDGDVLERRGYTIRAVAVNHGRPALGYVLEEPPRPGRFDVERALALGVTPGPLFGRLQRGESVTTATGEEILAEQVVGGFRPGRKVVVSGDTGPCPRLTEAASGADVLIHEATFSETEGERAIDTHHSTARQAGEAASSAGVKHLVLTHISNRYADNVEALADEARSAYGGKVTVAEDGMVLDVTTHGGQS